MTQQMSEKFQGVEKERADKAREEQDKVNVADYEKRRKIFFAPASRYQIAGFVKEIKQDGSIVQPEGVLQFEGNILVTDVQEEIDFIRNCYGFKNGQIKECKDMKAAQKLRLDRFVRIKGQRVVHTTVEESQKL